MKKIIILLTCIMGFLFSACTDEDHRTSLKGGDLVLSYSVTDQGAEVKTKTTVPAIEGEEELSSLYLLFFDYSENGSGLFVDYYQVTGELSMSSSISIPFAQTSLQNDKSYKILAIANLDQASYISESIISWIQNVIGGKTEYQAILNTMTYVRGAGIDPDDDDNAILPSEILMTGSAEKIANVKEVSLELTRALVRFDVQNLRKDEFDLVSVSIWNAPINTPVWTGERYDPPTKHHRYYGIKRERNDSEEGYGDELPNITGGLYCFENFVSTPQPDDEETTCLIVGIAPRFALNEKFKKEITYHRINVHPTDGGQNIKRNYVYKVSINNVNADGESSEHDAWTKGTNNLDLIINNWNLDENGMVLTDGKNTLVIPVKRVVLNPEGDEREYSIYTLGEGQVSITKRELPEGISVTLEGNRLLVTAKAMGEGEDERKGMIEITLNSLRGEINFVQSENAEEYLHLNFTQLSSFSALEITSIPDGYLEVTSSGSWTAKIYNNAGVVTNPGFAFNVVTANNPPVLELTSEENYGSNYVQIYTTGTNSEPEARYGFVIFTLDDNPEINRSLVLIQKGLSTLTVTPSLSAFTFLPTGKPSSELTNVEDDWVIFKVHPGYEDDNILNPWIAELDNGNFDIEVFNTSPLLNDQYVRIKSKGNNLTGSSLTDNLKISYPAGEQATVIRITQAALGLSLTDLGENLAAVGGTHGGVRVTADPSLTYNVQIVSRTDDVLANSTIQGAYLIGNNGEKIYDNTKITGRDINKIIYVGFHKLLTPNVNISPEITVRVSIDGLEDIEDMSKDFTVKQTALTPNNISAINLAPDRGSIVVTGHNYNTGYKNALRNTTAFGVNGHFYMPNNFVIPNGNWGNQSATIPSTINHFNANLLHEANETTSGQIYKWSTENEGILVINYDYNGYSSPFNSGRLLGLLNYTKATRRGPLKINTDVQNKKAYKYIFEHGPFGSVNIGNISAWSYDDERVAIGGYPNTAIPIVVDEDGNAHILIDPVNRVVFNGELQIFDPERYRFTGLPSTDYHRFLANYVAFIHNVAMYGSHFTDHFLDTTETEAPYDYKP